MIDMSSLSHNYATSASFAQQINSAVLQLKKAQRQRSHLQPSNTPVSAKPREQLASLLQALRQQLQPSTVSQDENKIAPVPEDVIDHLQKRHQTTLSRFIANVEYMENALADDVELDQTMLTTLDELCDVADRSASDSFRQLRRR